ncbi:hypothetical protein Cob_v004112 [Colletotrichum orbiculare MAFF 240422]|uniref:Uncharacterized protein n=1 Tax=Colletotrichum orbiculare (strain 104-T / ATCC 96160 / CBS 514.97 / LARS 414 / MAFF 240422) TaxID=1213857 RepID=A0A484FYV2_COLOR|nr:hypothetical protein Cob_v004112 [Colletotrichum orbiculare MAFF 240422]
MATVGAISLISANAVDVACPDKLGAVAGSDLHYAPLLMTHRGDINGAGLPQKSSLMQDDTSGFYRDSRVRNPVPSKLHGKTDTKNGNFGVMHMKLNTTWESRDRGAAAKRTSEGTQLAAKMAQTDRYVHIKRSRF